MQFRTVALSLALVGGGCSGGQGDTESSSVAAITSSVIASTTISSAIAGKCISNNGGKVQLETCAESAAQLWTYQNDAFVSTSGQCLNIPHDHQVTGQAVIADACNGTNAQRWTLSGAQIKSTDGLCLDVHQSQSANGTQIQISACNGTDAQKFSLPASFTAAQCSQVTDCLSSCLGLGSYGCSSSSPTICSGLDISAAQQQLTRSAIACIDSACPNGSGGVCNYQATTNEVIDFNDCAICRAGAQSAGGACANVFDSCASTPDAEAAGFRVVADEEFRRTVAFGQLETPVVAPTTLTVSVSDPAVALINGSSEAQIVVPAGGYAYAFRINGVKSGSTEVMVTNGVWTETAIAAVFVEPLP